MSFLEMLFLRFGRAESRIARAVIEMNYRIEMIAPATENL